MSYGLLMDLTILFHAIFGLPCPQPYLLAEHDEANNITITASVIIINKPNP
jgi:hypothetical protein